MLQLSQLVWTALNIPHEDSLKRSPSHKSSTVHSARSCLLFALSVAGTVCVRSILQYWLFQVRHHFRIQTCVTFGLWLDWLKKQTQHRICLPRCNKIGTKMHNLLIVDQDAMNIFLRLWTFLAHIWYCLLQAGVNFNIHWFVSVVLCRQMQQFLLYRPAWALCPSSSSCCCFSSGTPASVGKCRPRGEVRPCVSSKSDPDGRKLLKVNFQDWKPRVAAKKVKVIHRLEVDNRKSS